MSAIGHNSWADEAEGLYEQFKVKYAEELRLGGASVAEAIEAGKILERIKVCVPHGRWMEWYKAKGLTHNVVADHLLLARFGDQISSIEEISAVYLAVSACRDERDRTAASSARGKAQWHRDEAEVKQDLTERGNEERFAEAQDRKAVELEERIERRRLAREVAESDDPKQSALHLKRGAAEGGGDVEWYTPASLVSAARSVMGNIDLDPASCEAAQATVHASTWWSKEEDGLAQEWSGRVWLNPPYAAKAIVPFAEKLVEAYTDGAVTEACWLSPTNAADVGWAQALMVQASAVCLIGGRVEFVRSDGGKGGSAWASMVLYLGPKPERFCEVFGKHGACWHRGVVA